MIGYQVSPPLPTSITHVTQSVEAENVPEVVHITPLTGLPSLSISYSSGLGPAG